MHMIIRILIWAKDEEEAWNMGVETLNDLCGENRHFDYWASLDDFTYSTSGAGRWGYHKPIVKASSEEGKKWIEEGMDSNLEYFEHNLKEIEKSLKTKTTDQLWHDWIFRAFCRMAGEHEGSDIWLYSRFGSGIRNISDLKRLNKMGGRDVTLWVMPADVHY